MSNLTKIDVISKIPFGLREFTKRRIGNPPFKNYNLTEQKTFCLDIITKIHASVGSKGDDATLLTFQCNELFSCLGDKYGDLTLPEIEFSLERLIAGEAGEFFGLNKKSYYQALKSYFELPQRIEGVKEYLKILEAESVKKAEKPVTQILHENKESCLRVFERYKKTGEMPQAGAFAFYDLLWKDLKVINIPVDVKRKIRDECQKEYITELKQSKIRGQIRASEYEDIVSNLEGDSNKTLIIKVKKRLLKYFFDDLIKSDIELKGVI